MSKMDPELKAHLESHKIEVPHEEIDARLEEHGIYFVTSCDSCRITHSIGFFLHGLPEIICLGSRSQTVIGPMIDYYIDILEEKIEGAPGPLDYFNIPFYMIEVDDPSIREFAPVAFDYLQAKGLPPPTFLQWVWSDRKGILPWQKGHNGNDLPSQPILGPAPKPKGHDQSTPATPKQVVLDTPQKPTRH
ncbi:DUF4262 domain-containing protein [Pseudomonas aeruginosa]